MAQAYEMNWDFIMERDTQVAEMKAQAQYYDELSRSLVDLSGSPYMYQIFDKEGVDVTSLPPVSSSNVAERLGIKAATTYAAAEELARKNLASKQDETINVAEQIGWNIFLDPTQAWEKGFKALGWSGKAMREAEAARLMRGVGPMTAAEAAGQVPIGPVVDSTATVAQNPWNNPINMFAGFIPSPFRPTRSAAELKEATERAARTNQMLVNSWIPTEALTKEERAGREAWLATMTPDQAKKVRAELELLDSESASLDKGIAARDDDRVSDATLNSMATTHVYAKARTEAAGVVKNDFDPADFEPEILEGYFNQPATVGTSINTDVPGTGPYSKYGNRGIPLSQQLVYPKNFGNLQAQTGKNISALATIEDEMRGIYRSNLNERIPYMQEVLTELSQTQGVPEDWGRAYGTLAYTLENKDRFRVAPYGGVFTPQQVVGKRMAEVGADPRYAYQTTLYLDPNESNYKTILAMSDMSDQTGIDVDMRNVKWDNSDEVMSVPLFIRPEDGHAVEVGYGEEFMPNWWTNEERANFSANQLTTTRAKLLNDVTYQHWNLYDNPASPYANKVNTSKTGETTAIFGQGSDAYKAYGQDQNILAALFDDFTNQTRQAEDAVWYNQEIAKLPATLTDEQRAGKIRDLNRQMRTKNASVNQDINFATPYKGLNELWSATPEAERPDLLTKIQGMASNYNLNVTPQQTVSAKLLYEGQELFSLQNYDELAADVTDQFRANASLKGVDALDPAELKAQQAVNSYLMGNNRPLTAILSNPDNAKTQAYVYDFAEVYGIQLDLTTTERLNVAPPPRLTPKTTVGETGNKVTQYGPLTAADPNDPTLRTTILPGMAPANPQYAQDIGGVSFIDSGTTYTNPGHLYNTAFDAYKKSMQGERAAQAKDFQAYNVLHGFFMDQTTPVGAAFEVRVDTIDPNTLYRADQLLAQNQTPYHVDWDSARQASGGTWITLQPGQADAPAHATSVGYRLDASITAAEARMAPRPYVEGQTTPVTVAPIATEQAIPDGWRTPQPGETPPAPAQAAKAPYQDNPSWADYIDAARQRMQAANYPAGTVGTPTETIRRQAVQTDYYAWQRQQLGNNDLMRADEANWQRKASPEMLAEYEKTGPLQLYQGPVSQPPEFRTTVGTTQNVYMQPPKNVNPADAALAHFGPEVLATWESPTKMGMIQGTPQEQFLTYLQMARVSADYDIGLQVVDADKSAMIYRMIQVPEGKMPKNPQAPDRGGPQRQTRRRLLQPAGPGQNGHRRNHADLLATSAGAHRPMDAADPPRSGSGPANHAPLARHERTGRRPDLHGAAAERPAQDRIPNRRPLQLRPPEPHRRHTDPAVQRNAGHINAVRGTDCRRTHTNTRITIPHDESAAAADHTDAGRLPDRRSHPSPTPCRGPTSHP